MSENPYESPRIESDRRRLKYRASRSLLTGVLMLLVFMAGYFFGYRQGFDDATPQYFPDPSKSVAP